MTDGQCRTFNGNTLKFSEYSGTTFRSFPDPLKLSNTAPVHNKKCLTD